MLRVLAGFYRVELEFCSSFGLHFWIKLVFSGFSVLRASGLAQRHVAKQRTLRIHARDSAKWITSSCDSAGS